MHGHTFGGKGEHCLLVELSSHGRKLWYMTPMRPKVKLSKHFILITKRYRFSESGPFDTIITISAAMPTLFIKGKLDSNFSGL